MISLQLLHMGGTAGTENPLAAPRGEPRNGHAYEGGHGVLDALALAAVLVDRDRTVLHVNRAAGVVLRRRDALLIHKGLLTCAAGAGLQQLSAAVVAAASPLQQPSAVLLERAGAAPYQLSIAPVEVEGTALILFADPDAEDASLPVRLRALFSLTGAEAQLAVALSRGDSIVQIAAKRGVLPGTVRFQVKSVAAKMRCRRQAEIAAIVAHLPKLSWEGP